MITIRPEAPKDFAQVHRLHELAFEQPLEANLVETLRRSCPDALSLVAEAGDRVLGHILFTPVAVDTATGRLDGVGLAPMAVLPDRQRQGIGSQLVRAGLEILRQRGCPYVVVVGHPDYYPRFGFEPASKHRLTCQWDGVPEPAFMVLILDATAMAGVSGMAIYREEFSEIESERFEVSNDPSRLDIDLIHDFLSRSSYWASGRSREAVERSIKNSLCFGVYRGAQQVGFARVVTDYAVFGYLADVFVIPAFRGRGLSKLLMRAVVEHAAVKTLSVMLLRTRNSHSLYGQFGFSPLTNPEEMMRRSASP